ncbi:hypothetical protein HID58_000749 [Brassica napus]|uniref:BnaA01g07460D protein n=2 Tax=Brassica napus TaxID=3708 RepID=A0A078I315_BRANA|nr:uncharacterized protein LOC106386202 [Brassica napus]KAH0941112.1 hypothetical protein HID58_000749 [Brassica napus]CAF2147986.1 unnamed protein product [Brassica napus]CDY43498.1 BnaA01g07460D [Brassica napus]
MLSFQCSLHLLQPYCSASYNNHSNLRFHNLAPFRVTSTIQVPKIQRVRTDWSRRSVKVRVNGLNREMEEEEEDVEESEEEEEFTSRKRESYGGKKEDINYDKDPEFADILGDCLDNPEKAQKKMEERLRKKRNKILHTKTGSATSMQVTFNKFEYSNSYMWLEFHNAPLDKDIALITDAIRSWHILGRLGGYNSMNMQLSQAPVDKRPNYDAILGANIEPTTFYNIGDLEVQDNVARIWLDIGTSEPLILDVLINALTQISSDYVGIKKVVFGGSEFENWKENLTSEESGFRVHKI